VTGTDHELAALRAAHALGRPYPFAGAGLSMWPALRPGDVALFAAPGAPRPGDVCLAVVDGRLVAHRLIAREGDRLLLRGDAMPAADPPVAPAAVVGRLVAVRRAGRELPWPPPAHAFYVRALRAVHAVPVATRLMRVSGRLLTRWPGRG
jgi:hypothetical protein